MAPARDVFHVGWLQPRCGSTPALRACACRKLDSHILVMQSAKDRTAEYEANRLNGAGNRPILVQGQVHTRLIVVAQVAPQQMMEMAAKDNHVVDAFSPDRTDQPLRISVLPRRPRGCGAIADAHGTNTSDEYLANSRASPVSPPISSRGPNRSNRDRLPTHRLLLPFLRQPGAAQRIGERAAALFYAARGRRAARWATRRGTNAVIARRGGAGTVGARAEFVIQPQRQRDALARYVDLQDLDADDVAGLHHLAWILDEGF